MIVFDLSSNFGNHLVSGLSFSPDGQWLAARSSGGPFHLMDSRSGETLFFMIRGSGCQSMAFSEDSRLIAFALRHEVLINRIVSEESAVDDMDPPPRLTPLAKPILEPAGPIGWAMRKLFGAVRPAESPVLTEWFVEDRARRKQPFKPNAKQVSRLEGYFHQVGFQGPNLLRHWDWLHCREWDAARPTMQGRVIAGSPFGSATNVVHSLRTGEHFSISPCGEALAGFSRGQRHVAVWHWGVEKPLHSWPVVAAFQKTDYVKIAISSGAEHVAEMIKARIRLVDGRTGLECFTFELPNEVFTDIHLSANRDDFLASRKSGIVEVRSKRDGELIQSHDWGLGKITAVTASADGCRFAAAGAGKIVVWDAE